MRFQLPFFFIITAIALLFGAASPALATEYFVKIDGDDTDDGTNWAMAFLTISNAVAQTTDGDTITVSNGTYNIGAQIKITNSITVQSVNGATNTTIKRITPGGGSPKHRIFYLDHSGIVVDGFTITNGCTPSNVMGGNGSGGGVYMKDGMVKNCVITTCIGAYGGGLYINYGGIVSNCSIIKNTGTEGSGVFIHTNGTVVNCTISGNGSGTQGRYGGGIQCRYGGLVRNCLITGNTHARGAGVYFYNAGGASAGTVESCTISRNTSVESVYASAYGGGVYVLNKGTITNTIIYFNTAPQGRGDNWFTFGSGSTGVSHTCTTPALGGSSNTTNDPWFVNAANDNYRLLAVSPCIDTGTNEAWMTTAKDLDGTNRIINGTVDMGAYEFKVGDLLCCFAGDSLEGLDPHTVVFTSYVSGSDTNELGFLWDVDNNGSIDYEGPTVSIITNTYTSGLYTVVLTVTNAVAETNTYTRSDYIKVGPLTNYVDLASASPGFPYATWATAASNIQTAVDAGVDGTLVLVTDGMYEVSSQVLISDAITVRSVNGAEVTTIKAMDYVSSVRTEHADAVVDGFTITKDSSETYGGGVYMYYGGTVLNCVIKNNVQSNGVGGGVYLYYGGTVSNCTISGNSSKVGGGVRLHSGGSVSDCVITGNSTVVWTGDAAGGVRMYGGTLRNCLVADNSSINKGAGGVCLLTTGTVESCTISGNRTSTNDASAVGGLYVSGGTVRNCIIYFSTNTATGSATNWYRDSDGSITNSCTTPDASAYGTGNITSDPQFVDAGAGNYCLQLWSPCINVGTNQAWMTGAVDLRGKDRIDNGTVDMGAYESFMEGTIFIAY